MICDSSCVFGKARIEVKALAKSIWSQEVSFEKRPALQGDLKADVAVIGAGIAGLLTAHFLRKRGLSVVVLEADRIASGQTRNTTAKITCQHRLIYQHLLEYFGLEKARQYAAANAYALAQYKEIVAAEGIECCFSEKPSYVYAVEPGDVERLEQEVLAAQKLGLPASFVTEAKLPFSICGAVRFDNQAQFNPLAFLQAIAEPLTIYENTPVRSVENHAVYTDQGKVEVEDIVVAAHYPFINVPGFYFMRMYQQRSYCLALRNAADVDGMYLDAAENGLSLRNYKELLLLGGAGHRSGDNAQGGRYALLRKEARRLFPEAEEIACWSAQDCMTLDGVPYIGYYCLTTPHVYVATGFQKWGMTTAMAAGKILSDLICDKKSDWADVFSPQRFKISASAKTFLENTAQAMQGLSREFLTVPKTALAKLPVGHGGVVEHAGEKIGVYRKSPDEVYAVSTRCPHLGCQLEWNPDELSWDCPCHGSRFDARGRRLCGPALGDLPRVEIAEL